jgi:hypothetical protein
MSRTSAAQAVGNDLQSGKEAKKIAAIALHCCTTNRTTFRIDGA